MQVAGRDLDGEVFTLSTASGRWTEPNDRAPTAWAGDWCVPGLVDAHAHLSADRLELDPADPAQVADRAFAALEAGVFVCLDKGWSDDVVLRLARSRAGRLPTIQAAGEMLAPSGGYYPGFGREVSEEDLGAAAAAQAAKGGGWVKIVADWPRKGAGTAVNYGERAMAAAVTAVHAAGAKVAVHTMGEEAPSMAVRAGVDSVEHGMFLSEADLEQLAARGGTWVPTVLRVREVLDGLRAGSSGAELLGRGWERMRALLPLAAEMGVDLRAGTDLAVPSARVGAEAAALASAGLPPGAAVAAATLEPGSGLRVGAPADLVAFDTDPRSDPSVLLRPRWVVRNGETLVDRR